ncbi:hypothetical protein HY523_01195 [Candidatus Berkelbacteria bacterium]|nr:hypothetical protein [Candidatus Berkelbacteria bacterium]
MRRFLLVLALQWLLFATVHLTFTERNGQLYLFLIMGIVVVTSFGATTGHQNNAMLRGIGVVLPFLLYYLVVSSWLERALLPTHLVTSLMILGSSLFGVGLGLLGQKRIVPKTFALSLTLRK